MVDITIVGEALMIMKMRSLQISQLWDKGILLLKVFR